MIDYEFGVSLDSINNHVAIYQFREWRNHPSIRRWCRQVGLISPEQQKEWSTSISKDQSVRMFSILPKRAPGLHNFIVGACGLTSIHNTHRTAEFSIYIGKEHQRKGYGKAALQTLLRFGFDELNLNRIWGETFEGNPGAALYSTLGFTKEGELRESYYKEGKYINSSIWSIIRKDFDAIN